MLLSVVGVEYEAVYVVLRRPATLTLLTTTTRIKIVQTKNTNKHPSAPFFLSSVGIKRLVIVPSFVSDTSCPRKWDFI